MIENIMVLITVLLIASLIVQGVVICWLYDELKRIRFLLAIMTAERGNNDKD